MGFRWFAGLLRKVVAIQQNKLKKWIITLVVGFISLVIIFPLVLTVCNSLMSDSEIWSIYSVMLEYHMIGEDVSQFISLKLIPDLVTLNQYYDVLITETEVLFFFWNSVKLVVPIIVFQVVVSTMAAYAFTQIKFKFREKLFFVYVVTMIMPFQVTLVPNFIIADKLNILGQGLSIILPGVFSAFGVFLLRQFMIHIPESYGEAAKVDGASHLYIFSRIIMPMTKTGIASLVILVFVDYWNMVEQPLIFLYDLTDYPLSIMLSMLSTDKLHISFAASVVYIIPMVFIYLMGDEYLIAGLHATGIKG